MELQRWKAVAFNKLLAFLSFYELLVVGINCRKLLPIWCKKSSEDLQISSQDIYSGVCTEHFSRCSVLHQILFSTLGMGTYYYCITHHISLVQQHLAALASLLATRISQNLCFWQTQMSFTRLCCLPCCSNGPTDFSWHHYYSSVSFLDFRIE